jgi:divalent metal cation (Fe/Co/Zn/Cd) transporter
LSESTTSGAQRVLLTRLILLSLAAAAATIGLKTIAWRLTGSVGLLSDAVESNVNLVAAATALLAIGWPTRQPDKEHMYGHERPSISPLASRA